MSGYISQLLRSSAVKLVASAEARQTLIPRTTPESKVRPLELYEERIRRHTQDEPQAPAQAGIPVKPSPTSQEEEGRHALMNETLGVEIHNYGEVTGVRSTELKPVVPLQVASDPLTVKARQSDKGETSKEARSDDVLETKIHSDKSRLREKREEKPPPREESAREDIQLSLTTEERVQRWQQVVAQARAWVAAPEAQETARVNAESLERLESAPLLHTETRPASPLEMETSAPPTELLETNDFHLEIGRINVTLEASAQAGQQPRPPAPKPSPVPQTPRQSRLSRHYLRTK